MELNTKIIKYKQKLYVICHHCKSGTFVYFLKLNDHAVINSTQIYMEFIPKQLIIPYLELWEIHYEYTELFFINHIGRNIGIKI